MTVWERKQRLVSEGTAYQKERSSCAPRAAGLWGRGLRLKMMHDDLSLLHIDIVAPDNQLSSDVQEIVRALWSIRTNRYESRTSLE